MSAPVYLSHPAVLDHDTGAHPERADRIRAIEAQLDRVGWHGFERREAPRVDRALLEHVHFREYVAAVGAYCERGGGAIDADTIVGPGSWEAALRSAGGAVELVELLLTNAASTGFAAGRPPGHHAKVARAMGFCLFNNIALAATHALREHGLERVLIIDWDVHHGNGTNDIFARSQSVLFISIHQDGLWPGTGPATDHGAGDGAGFTVNLPVPRAPATTSSAASSRSAPFRSRASSSPSSCSSRRAMTRTRRIRSPIAASATRASRR